MAIPPFDRGLVDIYYLSNTPIFLYKKMRDNAFIQSLSQLPAHELVDEFNKRASTPIKNDFELAEIYAICVALTFKELDEVGVFFRNTLKIKFEWFADIANYYLENYKPAPIIQSIQVAGNGNINQYAIPSDTSGVTFSK